MKKTYHLMALAALLFVGAAITACSSSDNEITEEEPSQSAYGKYTLTVNATKAIDATTRALTLNGNTLKATWTEGDKVTVLKYVKMNNPGSWEVLGQLEVGNVRDGGLTCSLTGEIGALNEGDCLRLVYPGQDTSGKDPNYMDYTGQDGSLNTIACKYDYWSTPAQLKKAVKVTAVNGTNITTSDATFTSNQAIVRFTFLDQNNQPLEATTFTISAKNNLGTEQIVTKEKITGESSLAHLDELHIGTSLTNVVYVAVPGFSAQEIKLKAISGQLYRTYRNQTSRSRMASTTT